MDGLTVENMTILDTPGFSLKVSDSNHVVIRNVRTMWSSADTNPADAIDDRGGMDPTKPSTLDVTCVHEASFPQSTGTYVDANGVTRNYVTDSSNGGYAIYPVLSNDVLIDHAVALGASDAGIYVGQSNDVIVKNSEALFNVAGFEIENTDDADVFDNVAHCNTGGFLTFDLPGLNQYGDETRTFDNYSGYNNTPNFAPGGVVAGVPQGVGVLQLGYDEHEIFEQHDRVQPHRGPRVRRPRADRRQHRQPRQAHGPLSRGRARARQHVHHQRHARRSRPRRA